MTADTTRPSALDPEDAPAETASPNPEHRTAASSSAPAPASVDHGQSSPGDALDDEASGEALEVTVGKEPPKKKKKNKKKKNSKKPTGFEEYVVEGPLTAEQVAEENALYSSVKPFQERIELCIQRYRARKRWDPTRMQMFTAYLTVGGIKTGQKMWQGMDQRAMKDAEMNAEEIHSMTATDYVTRGGEDDKDWEVDFEYVARGYLSWKVPYVLCYQKDEELVAAANLIRNFLNYVVYHNVAPEYINDIKAASKICEDAEMELVLCSNVSKALPGRFNAACSVIFGGALEGTPGNDELSWYTPPKGSEAARVAEEIEWERKNSSKIYEAGLRIMRSEAKNTPAKVMCKDYMSLEVTEVSTRPIEKDQGGEFFSGVNTLGVLKVKPCVLEEDGVDPSDMSAPEDEEIEIWLERRALQYCFIGMKMEARVWRLDNGVNFIDSVTGVFCKFFVRLDDPSDGDGGEQDENT